MPKRRRVPILKEHSSVTCDLTAATRDAHHDSSIRIEQSAPLLADSTNVQTIALDTLVTSENQQFNRPRLVWGLLYFETEQTAGLEEHNQVRSWRLAKRSAETLR